MIAAAQPGFDLRNADGSRQVNPRPMVGMDWLRTEMCRGQGEDFVNEQILGRHLRWAFDLKRKGADFMFLLVWRKGFEHWRNPKVPLPTSWRDFYHDIFPPKCFFTGIILGTELQDALSFGSDHVYDLIEDGLIEASGKWQRGPGGSAQVTRISVEKFLQQRRLT